jgi:hypothetical protein
MRGGIVNPNFSSSVRWRPDDARRSPRRRTKRERLTGGIDQIDCFAFPDTELHEVGSVVSGIRGSEPEASM